MGNKYASVYKSEKSKAELLGYYDAILQKWPVPYEELLVETPSAKTHIIISGKKDGPPLLFFHGTGNNSLMWRYNVQELGGKYRLYLIDTLNDPGKSMAASAFRAPAGYAQWIKELLDGLNLDKVSLAGHSKGGWLALNTVISQPDRIDKTVLLAPAAGLISKLNPEFLKKSLRVGLSPTLKNVTDYLGYMYGTERAVNQEYAKYLASLIKGTKSRPIAHRDFTNEELGSIKSPVLLIFGEHEKSIDYQKAIERAKAIMENLKTVIVPETGHALQGEKPGEINRLILDFI